MLMEISTVAVIIISAYIWSQRRPNGYPPGPWGIPLLGHLHLLGDQAHETLLKWKDVYGPIFACQLGSFRGVVLTDPIHIKAALNDSRFSGRPKLRVFSERSGMNGQPTRGILFTEGQEWMEQRRFTLRHLKHFGFGKKTQEALIMDEVVELLEKLKENVGHPVSTRNRFNTAIINALWTMLAGVRHSQDDPEVFELVKLMTESMTDPSLAALFLPWLTRLAPEWSGWQKFMADILPCHQFLSKYIEEHRKSIDYENPRDFIDVYLHEIENTKDKASTFFGDVGEISIKMVLLDLLFASNETTAHTLSWAILYLALEENRKVQANVQDELDRVVGRSRLPTLADRPHLPYLEATISEVLRLSSVVPMGVWHETTEDVEFYGFHLPKGTMIIPLLYGVHHDPTIWKEPEQFQPARFLKNNDSTGVSSLQQVAFMPFSFGKRICIGESLAKDELFLIISSIIQNFNIITDPTDQKPSIVPIPGPISSPQPHKVVFLERK